MDKLSFSLTGQEVQLIGQLLQRQIGQAAPYQELLKNLQQQIDDQAPAVEPGPGSFEEEDKIEELAV